MSYTPGLHLLAELRTNNVDRFISCGNFNDHVDFCIATLGLSKVGEAYHDFPGGGFTAVVCLTESHLSIHTWPEHGLATFDVFLSNHRKSNDEAARRLFELIREFFNATVHNYHEILR